MLRSHLLADLPVPNGLAVVDPATGEVLSRVADMDGEAAESAIDEAALALRHPIEPTRRFQLLRAIAAALHEETEELARIITREQGKPLAESRTEVEYAAGFFDFFAAHGERLASESLGSIKDLQWKVHHRPAGVAALITPWNFPLAMLAKKVAPAIGAGCSMVVKPSELTPLSAIALRQLALRAGWPAERFQLVTGEPEPIGEVLCSHPAVCVVSFTGSTAVGRWLMARAAPHIKRLALELGGNAPFIVCDDADIEQAADELMENKFRCAGQTCVCTNRVYVQRAVSEYFTRAVVERVAKLRVGNGMEEGVEIGPLINREGWDKVDHHIQDALIRRAIKVFGETPKRPTHDWGAYFPPTVLTDISSSMLVARKETFGPVVAIGTFDKDDEAIELANDTPYGLAAYLFTADRQRAERMAARLQFGHVGINTGHGPTPEAPFGGMKQSGFGREGGVEGWWEYCETQVTAESF